MTVLTTGLNPPKEQNNKGILSRDGGRRGVRDTVILSLEGLHKAAILSNILGRIYSANEISCILSRPMLLTDFFSFFLSFRSAESMRFHICPAGESCMHGAVYLEDHEDEGRSTVEIAKQSDQYSHVTRVEHGRTFGQRFRARKSRKRLLAPRFHVRLFSRLLSDPIFFLSVFSNQQQHECFLFFFFFHKRCCLYVSKLEHDFFGRNQNPSLPKSSQQKKDKKENTSGDPKAGSQDRLKLNFNIIEEEETW